MLKIDIFILKNIFKIRYIYLKIYKINICLFLAALGLY